MGRWRKHLNEVAVVIEKGADRLDETPYEDLKTVRREIMAALVESLSGEPCFEDVAEEMRWAEDPDEVDDLITQMYDIADDERIWLGP